MYSLAANKLLDKNLWKFTGYFFLGEMYSRVTGLVTRD